MEEGRKAQDGSEPPPPPPPPPPRKGKNLIKKDAPTIPEGSVPVSAPTPEKFNWRILPRISVEDGEKYEKDVLESQGFDVKGYDGTAFGEYILPVSIKRPEDPFFSKYARSAVDLHNAMVLAGDKDKEDKKDKKEDLQDFIIFSAIGMDRKKQPRVSGHVEFLELVKMTSTRMGYWFLTLLCKDCEDNQIKTYQAIVRLRPGCELMLKLFRLKPEPDLQLALYASNKGHPPLFQCKTRLVYRRDRAFQDSSIRKSTLLSYSPLLCLCIVSVKIGSRDIIFLLHFYLLQGCGSRICMLYKIVV